MSAAAADARRAAAAACAHLAAADPALAAVIARVGPFRLQSAGHPFHALAGSIVHQQVSMRAAAAIRKRVWALCPRSRLTPTALLRCTPAQLRACGVSRQKAAYLHGLAEAFATRRLTPAKLQRLPDEDVIALVTELNGVGRWTAEMLLIFSLERPDVWPVDDFGLRSALRRLRGLGPETSRAAYVAAGEAYRPYRSFATWYLWRSLESPEPPTVAEPARRRRPRATAPKAKARKTTK